MHICFSSHCIALFPPRTPASWRSAKCTRRLFKVWINWPNSKLVCYSERGDHRLSFEYKCVGHLWKHLKLCPTIHAYLFFFTLYCIVSTENKQVEGVRSVHGGSLRYEGIGQIQNWYVILKGENIGFHLNINLSSPLKTSKIIPNHTCISVFLHTVLHCFHREHRQVEGVRSAHGGSLRYEGIGQIQNWYVILKGENLGFHLNINLSATFENF